MLNGSVEPRALKSVTEDPFKIEPGLENDNKGFIRRLKEVAKAWQTFGQQVENNDRSCKDTVLCSNNT